MSDNNRLKPAPFWLDDPELWFAQTEAQFWYSNEKDDLAKFYFVITQLDKHCLTVVRDVVLSPPSKFKYETLKSQLLGKLKESKMKNIKQILTIQDTGDRKPSQLLRYLKDLAGDEVDENYIKSAWSNLLPAKVQWVTSFLPSSSLEKIAHLADLALNSPSMKPPEIKHQNSIAETKSEASENDAMKELIKRVEDLAIKIEVMSTTAKKNELQIMSNNSKAPQKE